jgi:hypothetical protein
VVYIFAVAFVNTPLFGKRSASLVTGSTLFDLLRCTLILLILTLVWTGLVHVWHGYLMA